MYAEVFVSCPLDSSFTYSVPEDMDVRVGMRVRVEFGKRTMQGYVVSLHCNKPEGFKVKDIIEPIDDTPIFNESLVELAHEISATYLAAPGEVLSTALPSGYRPSDRHKHPFGSCLKYNAALMPQQEAVFNAILDAEKNDSLLHLIHGITGSGKTEVYIKLAQHMIERNRSVIYCVPEINLSSQIYERLHHVFGDSLIVYHSQLTKNQRLHNWKRFYSGDARIAIGTRSAIFLQNSDLGCIIIDEEHDGSYKENSTPRYNARRVAFYRSRREKCLCVLGSATPSIETMYAAKKGLIGLHSLTERYGDAQLPEVEIIKIDPEKKDKNLSPLLTLYTKRTLDSGHQVIYLLNRRGFSPVVMCGSCSSILECPHCNVSLTYHKNGSLLCHYCGYVQALPKICPSCSSEEIIRVGAGTQRVEESVEKIFNGKNVFRMDQDSTRKKGTIYDVIGRMNSGEIDILLGTQMVAKGFDFPRVSLVGVLLADIGLNIPDFRASERIFSLLVQVSGRSGRGKEPGRVIIQTLDDGHPLFQFLQKQDYEGFYHHELETRRALCYPPFSRLARLLIRGKNRDAVEKNIYALRDELKKNMAGDSSIILLGPAAAPLEKVGDNYRYHIILKGARLENLCRVISLSRHIISDRNLYLEIDIDPYDIL
jgi:primosomal protein N' (replication factor Y)